jgi:broad specificity phosphatase PhoE
MQHTPEDASVTGGSTAPATAPTWPARLWLVRHGESAGNVARDAAEAAGLPDIDVPGRDVDVALSPRGERQSQALGRWFAGRPPDEQPTVVLTSPFARAVQTAALVVDAARPPALVARAVDERLREKEFGALDRLTKAGIVARFPDEAERRGRIGKFYYRPPGGESWCDVILRLRSVLDHVQLRYRGERVLLVSHQVVVLCFRYLLEELTEHALLAIDAEADVANCSVTDYAFARNPDGREGMALRSYNFVAPLEEAGAPVTTRPDAPAGPR